MPLPKHRLNVNRAQFNPFPIEFSRVSHPLDLTFARKEKKIAPIANAINVSFREMSFFTIAVLKRDFILNVLHAY